MQNRLHQELLFEEMVRLKTEELVESLFKEPLEGHISPTPHSILSRKLKIYFVERVKIETLGSWTPEQRDKKRLY